ncbi:MAG: hypothetical protein LBI10_08300, partial [Deltaproteobacteria bacterium]|nr:hypothetical protein [Deltaproteobacteria bacterium]
CQFQILAQNKAKDIKPKNFEPHGRSKKNDKMKNKFTIKPKKSIFCSPQIGKGSPLPRNLTGWPSSLQRSV